MKKTTKHFFRCFSLFALLGFFHSAGLLTKLLKIKAALAVPKHNLNWE